MMTPRSERLPATTHPCAVLRARGERAAALSGLVADLEAQTLLA